MNLARKIASTIAIQAIGPLTLFFVVWLIGSTAGPESQGRFSALKSFVDLLVAFFSFGLPQSFVYGINQLDIRRELLSRWTLRYGVAIFAVLLSCFIIILQFSLPGTGYLPAHPLNLANGLLLLGLTLSIAGLVVASLMRGIFLTISDGFLFSLLTIQPVLWLGLVIIALIGFSKFDPLLAYSISGLASAFVGVYVVTRYLSNFLPSVAEAPLPLKALFGNGAAVFVQAMGMGLQPFLTFSIIRHMGGSYHDVAFFSIAMYVYQAGAIPLSMAAPILYNRWSNRRHGATVASDLLLMLLMLIPLSLLVGIGWLVVPWIISVLFKHTYDGAVPAIQILMLGMPLLYLVYVGMPALMSIGKFQVNTLIFIARLAICLSALMCFIDDTNAGLAEQAAKSWVLAECFTAGTVLFLLLRNFYKTPTKVLLK